MMYLSFDSGGKPACWYIQYGGNMSRRPARGATQVLHQRRWRTISQIKNGDLRQLKYKFR